MRRIDTSVDIDAPPERVWAAFADFGSWGEWNPFIPRLEVLGRSSGDPPRTLDELGPGARFEVRIEPPGAHGMTFRPRVVEAEPGRRFVWLGHFAFRGLFDGRHAFSVEPLEGGRTRFVHCEEFRGLLVPVLGGMLEDAERGFEAMNLALKERVEGEAANRSAG